MRGRVSNTIANAGQPQVVGEGPHRKLYPDLAESATCVLLAVLALGSPTVEEVAGVVGRKYATVHHHLTTLRSLGLVTWTPGEARSLRATCKAVRPCRG